MKHILLVISVGALLLAGCRSQKEFEDLEQRLGFYEDEALKVDSLTNEYRELEEQNKETEQMLKQAYYESEQLVVTNVSLNESFQELLKKYNQYIQQNEDIQAATAYEKLNLQEQLAAQQGALDINQQRSVDLEYDLARERSKSSVMEYEFGEMEAGLIDRDRRIRELEAMLNVKEETMSDLRTRLNDVLMGFSANDMSVVERNGKLYLSLSQDLLFRSGSKAVDYKGKMALKQVANILKQNADIDIEVEGHTDADGSPTANWDLSVDRATAVVKVLISYGVSPARVTASGRGEHMPVATNQTTAGKAANRRTEIIISPKLDELYNLLGNNAQN
ncbi:MAG: OmpA family protein [Bacteroidota bacterium]